MSNRGYAPSVVVETIVLLLQAGRRTLEDLRELAREGALLTLLGHDTLPDPDTVGDWLRGMGDPTTGQAGLEGLGQVRDALTARLLRRDGVPAYTLDVASVSRVTHGLGAAHARHAAVDARAGGGPDHPSRRARGPEAVVDAETLALFRGIRRQCWALREVT